LQFNKVSFSAKTCNFVLRSNSAGLEFEQKDQSSQNS